MKEDFDFNHHISYVRSLLQIEREAGRRINGLEEIEIRGERQMDLKQIWSQVTNEIKTIQDRIDGLARLPSQEQIDWAQSVQAMVSLRFLEIDTTGTGYEDEIVRIALADQKGNVIFDQLIKPERAHISQQASSHNGLTDANVADAPTLEEAWPRLQNAFRGSYIIAFNLEFDIKMLADAAKRHNFPAIVLIGECLQRRSTAYYMKEYYLNLEKVAARMGHKLENWDAPARLSAQLAILRGMANGITDLSQPEPELVSVSTVSTNDDRVLDNGDGLGDLDDHPF